MSKDIVTKFKDMKKILKNLDDKVTKVGSSIHEVFIVVKCERCKWDNLPDSRWVTKKNFRDNLKVPRRRRLLKLIRER
jgi:predicted nucleic-acid-binding Zn-ribbon protein